MEKYYCPKCQKIFEAEGKKKEWEDKIYGRLWKKVANCPYCQEECDEYRSKLKEKEKGCSGSCSLCGGCS